MVGTSAIRRPAPRSASAQACMAPGSVKRSMTVASAVRRYGLEGVIRVRVGRKHAGLHLAHVLLGRADDLAGQPRVGLGELRGALRKPEEIVQDEHLAVAEDAGPDADGRDRQLRRDLLREV